MPSSEMIGEPMCKENNNASSSQSSSRCFEHQPQPKATMSSRVGGSVSTSSASSSSTSSNNNPAAEPAKRRVLLPSLGGRKPLGMLSAAPSLSALSSAPQQQQQQQRRDSLDDTATQHTHSSASHFSASTAGSSSSSSSSHHSSSIHSGGYSGSSRQRQRVRTTAILASSAAAVEGGEENTSNSLSSAISYTKSYERVLRYGETMDSLFLLSEESGSGDQQQQQQDHHRTLCQEICSGGSKSSDANAWREALELSLEGNSNAGHVTGIGKRLIQLHRRATSRFKLSTEKDTPNQNAVLQIWLLYALVLLKYGQSSPIGSDASSNDARQTLKHVQRLYFGKNGKDFYGALVMQGGGGEEGHKDVDGVVTSLRQSMDRGASVVELVKCQMSQLEQNDLLARSSDSAAAAASVGRGDAAPARQILLPSLGPKKGSHSLSSTSARPSSEDKKASGGGDTSSRKHPLGLETQRISTRNQKDENDTSESAQVPAVSSYQRNKRPLKTESDYSSLKLNQSTTSESSSIKPSLRAKLESRKKLKTVDRTTPHPYRSRKSTRDGSNLIGGGCGGNKGGLRAILSQTMEEDDEESDDGENNNCLTAKRSADSCASAVTAKRSADSCASDSNNLFQDISPIDTEPTTSVKDMKLDYLLNWDPTKRDVSKKKKSVRIAEDAKKEKAPASVPKITRNDLGYMMNWNPLGIDPSQKKEDEEDSSNSSRVRTGIVVQRSTAAQNNSQGNNMSTIDEATEGSMTSGEGGNHAILSQSRASCSSQETTNGKNTSDARNNSVGTSSDSHHGGDNPSRNEEDQSSSQEKMISTTKLDCSFLPLIENKNIIRVEDEPYAKLGVIGKGGSCKVYRALSRDCDVVALKKVKLDGLNKAAIDGYANEIELLKRLKGNPAIIQLYSAEVDLERKSILLVMEVGEVDLNYVLRQQELMSSKQQGRGGPGRSSLNMNFIRLTWQQMLTAVHSIHEERIIHSDLKPANFLFVRGALKLIDFGIAKAMEREDTTNVYRETLSGTLSYMSPEAIMDTSTNSKGVRVNKCGRPSDIWSLGCILYQMVYGKTPFADCHGIPQKVLAITNVNHEISFPDDGIDESAIDAMKLCLQRNPKQRPPIIGENGLLNEHCFLHGRTKSNRR